MSFLGLFNEPFHRYGILIQQTSEITLNHSIEWNQYTGEELRVTVSFVLSPKARPAYTAPTESLSRVILSYFENNVASGLTCTDGTGRLWVPQRFEITMHHSKQTRGTIELCAHAPIEIDTSLIDPSVIEVLPATQLPRNNLLRDEGEWKTK